VSSVFGARRASVVRVVPFVLFIGVLALRGWLPAEALAGFDARWLYALQAGLAAAALAWWWREYGELARANRPTAGEVGLGVAVGLAVFGLWITLDAPWMTLPTASVEPFRPLTPDGRIDLALAAVRLAGAALVVPLMEELFWRSFLMRWLQAPAFEGLPPQRVGLKAIVLSTFAFMLVHTLWLAAIFAGLAYAWLYVRTGKLWVPVIAHTVTNGVLGAWVLATGSWQFW
jgi:CAAX prenyl protease-like protein